MPFSTVIELGSGSWHLDVATWPFEIEPWFLIQTCEVNFCGLGFGVGKLCGFHPFLCQVGKPSWTSSISILGEVWDFIHLWCEVKFVISIHNFYVKGLGFRFLQLLQIHLKWTPESKQHHHHHHHSWKPVYVWNQQNGRIMFKCGVEYKCCFFSNSVLEK